MSYSQLSPFHFPAVRLLSVAKSKGANTFANHCAVAYLLSTTLSKVHVGLSSTVLCVSHTMTRHIGTVYMCVCLCLYLLLRNSLDLCR